MSEFQPNGYNPEKEKTERLEQWTSQFKEVVEEGITAVEEFGASAPLWEVQGYMGSDREIRELEPEEIAKVYEILKEELGFDPDNAEESRYGDPYYTEGVPGQPSEGQIKIETFYTNREGVFLRRYTHQDGDIDWTVGPQELGKDQI